MEVCVTNFGGRIVSIMVPDKEGKMQDIVLGFDNIADYINISNDFGATIGRYANRIGDGKITIYTGNYSDYMEKKQLLEPSAVLPDSRKEKPAKEKTGDTRIRREKLKFTYQEQKDYENIEGEIAALEEKIEKLEAEIPKFARDFVKLNELTKEKEATETALEEKMERWMYLEDLAARIEAGEEV